jgi:hypothetical protein
MASKDIFDGSFFWRLPNFWRIIFLPTSEFLTDYFLADFRIFNGSFFWRLPNFWRIIFLATSESSNETNLNLPPYNFTYQAVKLNNDRLASHSRFSLITLHVPLEKRNSLFQLSTSTCIASTRTPGQRSPSTTTSTTRSKTITKNYRNFHDEVKNSLKNFSRRGLKLLKNYYNFHNEVKNSKNITTTRLKSLTKMLPQLSQWGLKLLQKKYRNFHNEVEISYKKIRSSSFRWLLLLVGITY